MEMRAASPQEILHHFRHHRATYEHCCREIADPRTATGVRHQTQTRAKVRDIGGVPHVQYRGEMCRLFATFYTLPSGKTFVACPTIIKQEK